MTVIGSVRLGSDKQDLQQQDHLLLKHAQQNNLQVGEFININFSSRKDKKERRINELMSRLNRWAILLAVRCAQQTVMRSPMGNAQRSLCHGLNWLTICHRS